MYFTTKYFDGLKNIAAHYLERNYGYYMFEYLHTKLRLKGASTIIVGSSYGIESFNPSYLQGGCEDNFNLSMSSQDLYYHRCHIKKAIEETSDATCRIKKCVIVLGWYDLYHDVSLSKNESLVVRKIYEPLWKDAHHLEPADKEWDWMYGVPFDENVYTKEMLQYFCEDWTRKVVAEFQGYVKGASSTAESDKWKRMTQQEREEEACKRAYKHNRLTKYILTCEENKQILIEMLETLVEHNIRPIIVMPPLTEEYLHYLNPVYRTELLQFLEQIPISIDFFDMNDVSGFEESDFFDSDHLNHSGAKKTTLLLEELLSML